MMVFLGSLDPPGPDLRGWWFPILAHLFLFGVLGILVSVSGLLAAGDSLLSYINTPCPVAVLRQTIGWLM